MDDLTDAQRSRLWAVFSQLDHKRRTHQIGRNECIREAYAACVRELPHEASLALVVRWGQRLQHCHHPVYVLDGGVNRARAAALFAAVRLAKQPGF